MTGRRASLVCGGAALVLVLVVALASAAAARPGAVGQPRASAGAAQDTCGLPTTRPLWIDYAEASVKPDVRAVLTRPSVIVASSGTAVPAAFRKAGVATVYFDLKLPKAVGEPTDPVDPATVPAAAAALLKQAQASTACATPWIALNELLGSATPAPWSPATAQYRANVLTLVQQLAAGGAHPVVLVHGDPSVAGAAADWWRSVARSADLVYEAYYDATRVIKMGPLMGTRRIRMGMRNVVALYEGIGIPAARIGFMLGFHSTQTPGIAGRQGLQPREAWFRVVKWETLAARQVAADEKLSSIWSWGWGTFGPETADPDKAAAACTYLWARNPALCDAPGMIGSDFNTSLAEGPVVLPATTACTFAGGRISQAAVAELTQLAGDPQLALTALFDRAILPKAARVSVAAVLAAEQAAIKHSFKGNRQAYLNALARRHATLDVARAVIADELRRQALATSLARSGSQETVLSTLATRGASVLQTAICQRDLLPGTGNFPASDDRQAGIAQLAQRLPFLFSDHKAPAVPAPPVATAAAKNAVTLTWTAGAEPDLAGYDVLRSLDATLFTKLNTVLLSATSFTDTTLPQGATATYKIRAADTSGNRSADSAVATITTPTPTQSTTSP
jgi:hypothetical protein